MKLTEFFERTYIVNLPERRDRRRDITRELDNAGMPLSPQQVEIFPAIRPEQAGEFPSIGTLGCFLSHLNILKLAHQQNLSNVLILEDDLAISKTLIVQQAALTKQLRDQKWDMVYFGYRLEDETSPQSDRDLLPKQVISLKSCLSTAPIGTTHFYGVNGSILERLIDFLEQIKQRPAGHPDGGPMHVDGAYCTFRSQNPDVITLIAEPNLGWQRSSRSDIHAGSWYDRVTGVRTLVNLARSGKRLLDTK